MKIAIVGSRELYPTEQDIEMHLSGCDEIVSGGASGVDRAASEYAKRKNIKLTEFLPKYKLYGRVAPIMRNKEIVNYADKIIVFWNGKSKGSLSVIEYAKKMNKQCEIILQES